MTARRTNQDSAAARFRRSTPLMRNEVLLAAFTILRISCLRRCYSNDGDRRTTKGAANRAQVAMYMIKGSDTISSEQYLFICITHGRYTYPLHRTTRARTLFIKSRRGFPKKNARKQFKEKQGYKAGSHNSKNENMVRPAFLYHKYCTEVISV